MEWKKIAKSVLNAVRGVEKIYPGLGGEDKKQKAIQIINNVVDIPFLPETIEAQLISILIDCVVEILNTAFWKKEEIKEIEG